MKKFCYASIFILLGVAILSILMLICFPIKHMDIINKYSQEYALSPAQVCSIINIESSFESNQVSRAGAVGLMQIMPTTALDMARRLDINLEYEDLFEEDVNIKLGCYYFRYLLDMFEGNTINALASYNWGFNNVKQWIAKGNYDKDGNITNIPIKETKDYISKYKLNFCIYKKVYGF